MWNVVSPYLGLWAGEPQGTLIEMRVEEVGKSESGPVMGWIGVQTLPQLERVQTSDGSRITRELVEPKERRPAR